MAALLLVLVWMLILHTEKVYMVVLIWIVISIAEFELNFWVLDLNKLPGAPGKLTVVHWSRWAGISG